MKNIFIGFLCLILFILTSDCSHNTNPQIRIKNESPYNVNVSIKSAGSDKFSINDVEPGQTSLYQTASVGNVTATAVIQNESISFPAAKSTHYTIIISTGKPPSLQIDQ